MSAVTSSIRAFCKKSLASHDLSEVREPWLNTTPLPPLPNKAAYRAWCSDPLTDSVFFTMCEGENPALPVGGANKAVRMHGYIADFDAPGLSAEEIAAGIMRANPLFPPFAWNRTFSGGARVVWLFEEPVFIYSPNVFKRFIKRVVREVKAASMFPGLDDTSEQAGRFFTAGNNWSLWPGAPIIRAQSLHFWLAEVSKDDDFDAQGVEIPMDRIAAEVEKRFPNRWQGDFALGARGVRFWDPTADALSVIVRSNGCQCFSGPAPFMTWEAIFGRPFVQAYLEDRLGAALKDSFYDGAAYYRQLPDERWDAMDTSQCRRHLSVRYGLSTRTAKEDNESEVERALHRIEITKRIEGALPFPHNPNQIVKFNGKPYLNTSNARLWQPSLDPQEWGVNFPWIADYLGGLFIDEQTLQYFMSWLHLWLKSCHDGEPRKGQALFIVGPPGTGKTLLSTVLLNKMVGGSAEATKFIVDGDRFNEIMFEKALLTVDDAIPGASPGAHAKFSAFVKSLVANGTFRYEKKFGKSADAPLTARLIVTLNEDPNSLSIIPDTDSSLLDKVSILRTSSRIAPVVDDVAERYRIIHSELSAFVRFVLDYQIPETVEREARFGIKSYHDATLLEDAQEVTASASVLEAIDVWKYEYARVYSTQSTWSGSATELLGALKDCSQTTHAANGMTARWLGRLLAQAASNGVPGIGRSRRRREGAVSRMIEIKLPTQAEVNQRDTERAAA